MAGTPRSTPDGAGRLLPWLLLIFVMSGAAGLVYEVVWARQLVLVFGNTSQAVSAILTGFFGGLAIGGAIGGRVADRVARPLRMYALLELAVVVTVLLTPASFRLIGEAYRGIFPELTGSPEALALVRFALAVLALAPATTFMGATLPTLTRYLTHGTAGIAGAFARLYAANTIGAILGTLLAGFVLIEMLGLTGALVVGVLGSGTAGFAALLLDWRMDKVVRARPTPGRAPDVGPTRGPGGQAASHARTRRLALALAFVSGLTSLGYQVVWNRLLGAGTGNSTYVFTAILALFLFGIAYGALLFGAMRTRVRSIVGLIASAQIATALLVALGAALLASPSKPLTGWSPAFPTLLAWFAVSSAIVVLPPTIAMGITFPASAGLLGDESGTEGSAAGSLLAVNTAGSIAATFLVPFIVIPAIGSPATLAVLATVNALTGAVLWSTLRESAPARRLVGGLGGAATAGVVIAALLTGIAFRSPTIRLIEDNGGTVFAATEDEIASVEAGDRGGRQLWVGGSSMTLITVDTKLLPLIPIAARPEADRALVIAFGMGTSFRTSLIAGVRTDAIELVPSVPDMFPWFYPDADEVLADPLGRVIVADGRNFVELSDQSYDFVVVDPPPPIESSGTSVISTLEFYRAARARLNPGGIMVQWVPFGQTLDEFLAHVRTFAEVFANVRVVAGAGGFGLYMIGSDGAVDLDPEGMRSVLERPGVLADLNSAPDSGNRTIDAWIATITVLEWAAEDTLRAVVGDGPVITDDRPLPEYFLLRRLMDPGAERLSRASLRALLANRVPWRDPGTETSCDGRFVGLTRRASGRTIGARSASR